MINLHFTSTRKKLRAESRHGGAAHALAHNRNRTKTKSSVSPVLARDVLREKLRFEFEPVHHSEPPHPAMRVLLRNDKTMKYLRSQDHWTKNPKKARDFRNGWWATLCAFTMDPRNLVIQYDFEDERYNMNIPVVPGVG